MSNPYSTLKAAWHTDRIKALRDDGVAPPVELQLILSDLCNQSCTWCAYRAEDGLSSELFVERDGDSVNVNPKRMIPGNKAGEIIRDAASLGVKAVIFTGGGEPTVHPDHLELFSLAMDLGMDASMNTNGVIFRPGWEGVLPRMTYVRFSIDAAHAQQYARIRSAPEAHYGKALGNMRALVAECTLAESPCVVGAGYVVGPDSYVRMREGIERIRDTGVSYVRLAAMQSTDVKAGYGDAWEPARAAARRCADLSCDDFQVIDLMDSTVGERPDYKLCGFQHFVIYVGGDLNVYRCCYTAYTSHGLSGSLRDRSLLEWYEDEERRADYRAFDAKSCDTCPLNDKNRTISYLCEGEPMHVNFV